MVMLRRICCASLDGNLIYDEINILNRKNAVIVSISSENAHVCFNKILYMDYHTRSALSLLVFRVVENLTANDNNNLAAQTLLLIEYVTNSSQEKKIFFLPFPHQKESKGQTVGHESCCPKRLQNWYTRPAFHPLNLTLK